MVYFPNQVKGKAWKLARPYHGPYQVLSLTPTNAEVCLVGIKPQSESIFIALDRIRDCPAEMTDETCTWTGLNRTTRRKGRKVERDGITESGKSVDRAHPGPITRSITRGH